MLDVKLLRSDLESVKRALARRGESPDVCDRIVQVDKHRRETLARAEELKAERNAASQEIGRLKKSGQSVEIEMERVRGIGDEIVRWDAVVAASDGEIETALLMIPNLPSPDLPDRDLLVVKVVGEARSHDTPHWDIGTSLGILDFERGAKLSGSRFYVLVGTGALLERALITFMLDLQLARGYREVIPPYLVSTESMRGTGQYPKFQDEYFKCASDDLSLIPTAEVPVTNLHRDEILETLPVRYVSATPCFRREAGSYGKDTRGIIRVHQFHKIELVKFVSPDDSAAELESLTQDAEAVLEALELPYRRVMLPANDLGFSAAKTYDIEVWMPSQNRYVELSSCSNFTDYQARRMRIRFRRGKKSKPELVHTLNGSAVAVGRCFAAILENGLRPDGSVVLPRRLRAYMGGIEIISA